MAGGTAVSLKPCPFCGSKDIRLEEVSDYWEIICDGDVKCHAFMYGERDEIIEAWNNREAGYVRAYKSVIVSCRTD